MAGRPGPSPDGSQGWGFGVGVQVRRTGLGPPVGGYGWSGGLGSSWANDPDRARGRRRARRRTRSPALSRCRRRSATSGRRHLRVRSTSRSTYCMRHHRQRSARWRACGHITCWLELRCWRSRSSASPNPSPATAKAEAEAEAEAEVALRTRSSPIGTRSARQAFTAAALTPAEGHTIFAYVGIAEYDAVMAIEGGFEPFSVDIDAPEGASAEAAVAAAAHRILLHYLPAQATGILDPAYAGSLATIPDGQAKSDGVATGEQVAAALIALRADDGFRAPVHPPSAIPGVWIPTPATPTATPIGPYLGLMRPFSLDSADQFRPDGPPDLRSRKWARDYNEVKDIGSSTSMTRTTSRRSPHGSGARRRCSRRVARSAGSCSTRSSTSCRRHGSTRCCRSCTPTP